MRNFFYKNIFYFIIAAFFAVITGNADSAIVKSNRVAVFPFKINAEKDLSFLQDGIFDMLAFRLSSEVKMTVISREETEKAIEAIKGVSLNENRAREIGAELNADYVVFGSVTVFGDSVSINAKMTEVAGEKTSVPFFDQTREMGEVIPKINRFVIDIKNKIFAGVPQPVKPDTSARVKKTVPPEEPVQQKKPLNPAFIMSEGYQKASHGFWKSTNYNYVINGISLGDVDEDSKIETVVVSSHEVYILQFDNNRFSKPEQIAKDRQKNCITVDVADINGNGFPEIFVTCLNKLKTSVSSFVIEWNGQKFVRIIDDSSWLYRVVQAPGQESLLLGQKIKSDNPFSGDIFEMAWKNTSYVPGKMIMASKNNSLIGLAFGDIMNNGKNMAVAYDQNDNIQIVDSSGNEIWTGSEKYGGINLYYSLPRKEPGIDNYKYLPMRLYIRDIDSDGNNEVVAVRNYEMTRRLLTNFRKFTDARIESLSWNGLGLAVNWKTEKTSGHISDFVIGDFDNDGKDELAASVIIKDGAIIGTSAKSTIIAYDLNK
ncbi:MAG: hypothetical protein GY749_33560 [Desulfobacteraceae bacterium]|nr:hypothetical protein [Desulfobacteraceae bacterium]